jgi:hypothetical protein
MDIAIALIAYWVITGALFLLSIVSGGGSVDYDRWVMGGILYFCILIYLKLDQ